MSSLLHPTIPSFYACYLLRSYPPTNGPSSSSIPKPSTKTYVGSTPSPPRRLRQHNGELTAGAWRTRTGRPWEMDMLVWGFGSKIAALQFEWAWQKPHLSRHLKEEGGGGRAIWRSATKRGRFSPGSQVLILRSLLRSEPFCHWGLRVTCLAEWSWKAWRRLEEEEEGRAAGRAKARGRQTGRVMPPNQLSAAVRCDFTGVSGKRKPLTAYSEEERRGMGLRDVPVAASTSSAKGKGKAKAQDKPDGRSKSTTTSWHETLPTGATARGMGVTWHELEHEVPVVPAVVPTEEQAEEQAERTWPPRFATDDADFTFLALQRLNRFCSHHNLKPQDLVPTPPPPSSSSRPPPPPPSIPCASCHTPINVHEPLSWTLCPSPFHALTPRSLDEAEYEPVAPLGDEERLGHSHCASAFHLTCLAQRWLKDEEGQRHETEILPLAGRCPTCSSSSSSSSNHPATTSSSSSSPGLWADVVRSIHRRKEWLESGPGSLDFSLLGRVVGKARKRKRVLEERTEASGSDEEEGEGRDGSEEETEEEENESVASGESDDGSDVEMVTETPAVSPVKRKVGRPKGSKNREKVASPPRKRAAAASTAVAKGRGASAKAPSPKEASPRKRTASSKKTTAAATTSTSTASTAQPPQASSDLIASLDDMFG